MENILILNDALNDSELLEINAGGLGEVISTGATGAAGAYWGTKVGASIGWLGGPAGGIIGGAIGGVIGYGIYHWVM